jgi:hypothetical protein
MAGAAFIGGIMADLQITEGNAKKLAEALWHKITDTGFNALSKNDFYDYVLYLFNKFSATRFLDSSPAYENSLLLRVPLQKIKASKRNIFLKYAEEAEKNTAQKLLSKIADKSIALNLDGEKKEYTLTVDDYALRDYLDSLMKRILGTSYDYRENHEIIVVSAPDFYAILGGALEDMRSLPGANTKSIESKLAVLKKDEHKKILTNLLISGAVDLLGTVTPFPVKEIIETAKLLAL